jgi:hypothetical protein
MTAGPPRLAVGRQRGDLVHGVAAAGGVAVGGVAVGSVAVGSVAAAL